MTNPKNQFVDVQGVRTRYWKAGNEGSERYNDLVGICDDNIRCKS
jgi:hypothetical protein